MLLIVESESGMLLDSELLAPEPGLVQMWGTVPMKVVHQLARMGILPREIKIRSFQLLALLQLLEEELDVEVKAVPRLRSLDRAKEALLHRFV
jgi:hypothetical protein